MILFFQYFFLFNADTSSTPPYPATCGGTYTATNTIQQFASPGYPIRYPPSQYCEWTITADPGNVVLLAFQDFELESNCGYDNVTVFDEPPRK